MDLERLQEQLRTFARERDWAQFHSPKNLAMALSVEAGELLELFQWLTEAQSKTVTTSEQGARRVREELADVFIYLMRLADVLGIDLEAAVAAKLQLNADKYPIDLARGSATKAARRHEQEPEP
jgi:dCTP diphosphatase